MGDKVLQFEYSAWGPLVQAVRRTKVGMSAWQARAGLGDCLDQPGSATEPGSQGLVHDLREACEVVFSLPADNEAVSAGIGGGRRLGLGSTPI
jgi:hypothetical protein